MTTDRFEQVASVYAASGLDPLPLPTIRFEPASPEAIDRARRAAEGAQMLLVTSARTVGLLWPDGGMPPVPVAAVGRSTASAVQAAGGNPEVVGASGLADLARQLALGTAPDRLVFPRAAGSDPDSLSPLRRAAVEIDEHEIYRSVPVPPPDTAVDAVSFASPSAVEGWCMGRGLDGLVVAVIGTTTERAVARHRPADLVAPEPSHEAMAQTLASHLEVKV